MVRIWVEADRQRHHWLSVNFFSSWPRCCFSVPFELVAQGGVLLVTAGGLAVKLQSYMSISYGARLNSVGDQLSLILAPEPLKHLDPWFRGKEARPSLLRESAVNE